MRGRVHEVELEQVFDAERFEEEDSVGEVGALDLGDVVCEHLVSVRHLCV